MAMLSGTGLAKEFPKALTLKRGGDCSGRVGYNSAFLYNLPMLDQECNRNVLLALVKGL